jgi:hypothetical protein
MMQQGGQPMLVLSQNTKRETGRKAQTSNIQVSYHRLCSVSLVTGRKSSCFNRQNDPGTESHA